MYQGVFAYPRADIWFLLFKYLPLLQTVSVGMSFRFYHNLVNIVQTSNALDRNPLKRINSQEILRRLKLLQYIFR